MKKRNKSQKSFHMVNKFKHFTSTEGYNFWAKDEEDAKLYLQRAGWGLDTLKEVSTAPEMPWHAPIID